MTENVEPQTVTISKGKLGVALVFAVALGFVLGILFPATRGLY